MTITIAVPTDKRLRVAFGENRGLGREATRDELERWLVDLALDAMVDEIIRKDLGVLRVSHLLEPRGST